MWFIVVLVAWFALGYLGARLVIKYEDESGFVGIWVMLMGPFGLLMGSLDWSDHNEYKGPDFDKMLKNFFHVKD